MFDDMVEPQYPVHDDYGREIGTVQRAGSDPRGATLWRSRGLDGADLGTYPDRDEAHIAVRLDWALGRPRTADRHERYHRAAGVGMPVYLGH
jgi:hypothetical protein